MKGSLIEHFDEVLNSHEHVLFVDDVWATTQHAQYHAEFGKQVKAKQFHQFDASDLSKAGFVSTLARKHLDGVESSNDSNYRIIIETLDAEQSGVIVIHQSQLLTSDIVHLISRILRYAQRRKLEWRFVFFGQPEQMNETTIDQLFVERFYPSRISKKTVNAIEADQGKKFSAAIIKSIMFIMFVAGGLALFYGSQFSTSNMTNNSDSTVSVVTSSNNVQTVQANKNQQPSEAYLEMLRESKLRDLEFKGVLSQIDSTQQEFEQGVNQDSVIDQPIAAVIRQEKTQKSKQQLPADIEQAVRSNDFVFLQTSVNDFTLLDGINDAGETPLIIASNNSNKEIVKWLLNNDVAVNSKDNFGQSALYYAAINGETALVDLLLQGGARVDLSSRLLKTPLMAAVHNDHFESAQILLSQNADVNAIDHSGWSALFYAVWNGNAPLIELLKANGASSELLDNSGLTVKEMATVTGHTELLDIL